MPSASCHLVNEFPDDCIEVEPWPQVAGVHVSQLSKHKDGPCDSGEGGLEGWVQGGQLD